MSGNLSKSAFFEGGWVTLNADFRGKVASPTNHSWCQSSRVIALSCGIKISALHHLDLSQSTRVIDGQTDRRTDRQNYDSQDRPRICSRGNDRFGLYGAEHSKCNHMMTACFKGLINCLMWATGFPQNIILMWLTGSVLG